MADNLFSAFRLVRGDVPELNREIDQVSLAFTRLATIIMDLENRVATLEFEQGSATPGDS